MSVAVATVAAFLAGGAYYSVVPLAAGDMPRWKYVVELWIGFPFVLWVGAVIHENTPIRLAAIHGGDWLLKLLMVGVIAAVLQ